MKKLRKLGCGILTVLMVANLFAMCVTAKVPDGIKFADGGFENGLGTAKIFNQTTKLDAAELTHATGKGVDGTNCAYVSNTQNGRLDIAIDDLNNAQVGDIYYVSVSVKLEDENVTWGSGTNASTEAAVTQDQWGFQMAKQFKLSKTLTKGSWTTFSDYIKIDTEARVSAAKERPWFRVYLSENLVNYGCGYYIDNIVIDKINDNLIKNPNFDNGTENWNAANSNTVTPTIDTTAGVDGSPCLFLNMSNYKGDVVQSITDVVTAGKTYYVSVKMKMGGANPSTTAKVIYGDRTSGSWVNTVVIPQSYVSNTDWTTLGGAFTVSTATTNGRLQFRNNDTHDLTSYMDDVALIEMKNGELINPNFEDNGLLGWYVTYSDGTAVIDTANPAEGSSCAKITAKGSNATLKTNAIFEEGKTYKLSAKIKYENTEEHSPEFRTTDGIGLGTTTVSGTDWNEITTVFTATSENGMAGVKELYIATGTQQGDVYYLDDFVISEVTLDNLAPQVTFSGSAKEAGKVTASVTFSNAAATAQTCNRVFVALYNGEGKLVNCTVAETDVFPYSVKTKSAELTVTAADQNAYAKIFVWNNYNVPYIDATPVE